MAIKFEKIKPDMTLYDRQRSRMGNTTLRTIKEWPAQIISVDQVNRTAQISWNGNPAEVWHRRRIEQLYDWSMYDQEVAEIVRGPWDSVVSVKKKRKERASG